MNLELLDPFRRQIPDRIDSTLNLPSKLHVPAKGDGIETTTEATTVSTQQRKQRQYAANHVAFNRRGSYVAVAYTSGTIAVFDILSRTVSSLYRFHVSEESLVGISALSWSRRSRTLLAGCMGQSQVMVIDATHPSGPQECNRCNNSSGTGNTTSNANKLNTAGGDAQDDHHDRSHSPTNNPTTTSLSKGSNNTSSSSNKKTTGSFAVRSSLDRHFNVSREVNTWDVQATPRDETWSSTSATTATWTSCRNHLLPVAAADAMVRRYPSILFSFSSNLGASMQIHPKDSLAGQAVLQDGSIVVFSVPKAAFEENSITASKEGERDNEQQANNTSPEAASPPPVIVSTVFASDKFEITCTSFDPHGERLYAGTKDGKLLGFEVANLFQKLLHIQESGDLSFPISMLQPSFVIAIPGGATVWHMVVSRNGRYLVLNSADAAIRLYETSECWTSPDNVEKPLFVFQDVVQKVKFASCDISGDSEYVVGGTQGNKTLYELYIWNTSSGNLVDKLTGVPANLSSVAWHPTRNFLAVAASDGLVDIWGARKHWTAFAPDFQALPQNVEYVEREDEFDTVVDDTSHTNEKENVSNSKCEGIANEPEDDEEKTPVDILTLHRIPFFQSDSEDESDVFQFEVVRGPVGNRSLVD